MILDQIDHMYDGINVAEIASVALFIGVVTLCAVILFLVNDKVFDIYSRKRIKSHHLTIKNHGNVPSIFLLRTVDLPKTLAVRFRVGSSPMIWVSRREKDKPKQEPAVQTAPQQQALNTAPAKAGDPSLVPNLDKPFEAVNTARQEVNKVSRKAGLIAGIITSVTNLLPFLKNKKLQEAQDALKGFQQDTSNVVNEVNTKLGNVDTLSNQIKSVAQPGQLPFGGTAAGGQTVSGVKAAAPVTSSGRDFVREESRDATARLGDFICDEEIWHKNIGKVDENGGSLVYAQSRILKPGESMKIDVELMNLSESSAPVSMLYKIEVLQIPQSKLQLAAPKQYISGIVIFPKISEGSRIIPAALMAVLIVVVIQLLAVLSHLLFK